MTKPLLVLLLLPCIACQALGLGPPGHSIADGGSQDATEVAHSGPDASDPFGATAGEPEGGVVADVDASVQPLPDGAPPENLAAAVAAAVSEPSWNASSDGGSADGLLLPDDASLPPPVPGSNKLALAGTAKVFPRGCGEPSLCYLRAAITTGAGRTYTARLSTAYPNDTCARDIIDDGKNLLIGDPGGRLAGWVCSRTAPQVTVGFLIPTSIFETHFERVWTAYDGFRSQWTIADGAPGDDGLYVPAPRNTSTLDLLWYAPVANGEAYGSLVVPLRNKATGTPALGEVIFDVRIR
jgi:hypothetical protein